MAKNNGSVAQTLRRLFMSPKDKELESANRRRRIDYLKRKYGKKQGGGDE